MLGFFVDSPTSLFVSIGHVVLMRAKKQMNRINAGGIVTFMQYPKSIGDWAMMQFVGEAVRGNIDSAYVNTTISQTRPTAPKPARCAKNRMDWPILINILPEPFFDGSARLTLARMGNTAGIMSMNITKWFPLNPPSPLISVRRNRGGFSTAAHAQTAWVWLLWLGWQRVMAARKTLGLSFDISVFSMRLFSYGCFLTTATVAITKGNFLGGILRGMIVHVISSFKLTDHATERLQPLRWQLVSFSKYSTSGLIGEVADGT